MSGLRDQMPSIAAFVDEFREAFGREMVDDAIRRGMKGEPTFYAEENGATLGTRPAETGQAVSVGEMEFWANRKRKPNGA